MSYLLADAKAEGLLQCTEEGHGRDARNHARLDRRGYRSPSSRGLTRSEVHKGGETLRRAGRAMVQGIGHGVVWERVREDT